MSLNNYLLLVLVVLCFSCKDNRNANAVEALIKNKLEERLAEYERIRKEKCQEEIMTAASLIVDSILIKEAKASKDTLKRPAKPPKPPKPEIRTLIDSTPIAPILQKKKDSLLNIEQGIRNKE